jgi:hypothetical protein
MMKISTNLQKICQIKQNFAEVKTNLQNAHDIWQNFISRIFRIHSRVVSSLKSNPEQTQGEPLPLLGEGSRPPSSPDCNQFDHFVCAVFQKDINEPPHKILQSLIISIMEVFSNFSKDYVKRACSHFRWRLKEFVAAEWYFID